MADNIISYEQMLGARLKREQATGRAFLKRLATLEDAIPSALVREAARREDTVFISSVDSSNTGMKMLRGHPRHGLLIAVFNDAIKDFWKIRISETPGGINERSYWAFPDRPKRAYFTGPVHVCRHFDMAVNLHQNGADFRLPDSEGHLPFYFLSRYAADPHVIPYLVELYGVNANDSGRWQNGEFPGSMLAYDPPIFRAIKYGNLNAVKGLNILPRQHIDRNRPGMNAGLPPLVYAVMMAEEHIEQRSGLFNRLAIVKNLAECPFVDPQKTDATGWTARDYAVSPIVKQTLEQGLKSRAFNITP